MPEFLENVGKYWLETKKRYNWHFVTDPDELRFIQEVAASIDPTTDSSTIIKAIKHCYNRWIYNTIVLARNNPDDPITRQAANRACEEVWTMARNMAWSKKVEHAEIEDIAQEVTLRLLANPEKVDKPESLHVWIMFQVLDLRKRLYSGVIKQNQVDLAEAEMLAATINLAALVETHSILLLFNSLLKEVLSTMQYVIICLHLIGGEPPHEVAKLLNLDPHSIHSQKYRALKIIRKHPKLRDLLESFHEQ